MTRNYCINHLINQECYPDDEFESDVSQLWHNAINGESCYVPYVDELSVNTYCHIFFELKIDPPLVDGYDSEYAIYVSFRDAHMKEIGLKIK